MCLITCLNPLYIICSSLRENFDFSHNVSMASGLYLTICTSNSFSSPPVTKENKENKNILHNGFSPFCGTTHLNHELIPYGFYIHHSQGTMNKMIFETSNKSKTLFDFPTYMYDFEAFFFKCVTQPHFMVASFLESS